MRLLYLIFFTFILANLHLDAQQRSRKMSSEQLESQKIAFITMKLELTPEEAQNFWPVYNEYQKEVSELKKNNRTKVKFEELTEESAEEFVMNSIKTAEAELDLKKQYIANLKGIISMKKLAKLNLLEHEFKREMLRTLRERRSAKKEKPKK